MEKDLEEFLSAFGYACEKADRPFLTYAIEKAEQGICHFCNLIKIPIELKEVVLSRAAGEFLLWKQSMGKLEHMNVSENAIKSIQVGFNLTAKTDWRADRRHWEDKRWRECLGTYGALSLGIGS